LWASGYAAYEKLSPGFRKIIDGKKAYFKSAHTYLNRGDPNAGPKHIERIHPIVRVHPATGWKSLFVNRAFTTKIVGLDKAESDVILNYLFDVYERVSIMLDREILSNKITNMSSEHRHPAPIQMDS
jgi:alpha-ketoglutarate-dependent taurine dioxygenase